MPDSVLPSFAIEACFFLRQGFQMSSIQRRIVAVTDSTAYLVAQLRELDELREQVRRALRRQNRKSITPGFFSKRPVESLLPAAATGLAGRELRSLQTDGPG